MKFYKYTSNMNILTFGFKFEYQNLRCKLKKNDGI
jgi:hypothetical protein